MSNTKHETSVEAARLSTYRFLTGAKCDQEDLDNVKTLIRLVGLVLMQEPVAKAVGKTVRKKVSGCADAGRAICWASSLRACQALADGTLDFVNAKEQELN